MTVMFTRNCICEVVTDAIMKILTLSIAAISIFLYKVLTCHMLYHLS